MADSVFEIPGLDNRLLLTLQISARYLPRKYCRGAKLLISSTLYRKMKDMGIAADEANEAAA